MNLFVSLLSVLLFSILFFVYVYKFREGIIARLEWQGRFLLIAFVSSFLVPAACWLLALTPPLNDFENPLVLGTGGVYGLNRDYFYRALFLYILIPTVGILSTYAIPVSARTRQKIAIARILARVNMENAALVVFIVSAISAVWYFSIFGWDRFWFSELGRFENVGNDQTAATQTASKFLSIGLLVFGCLGAALTAFRGAFWFGSGAVLFSSIPFIAFASRGMTVLSLAYGVAIMYRVTPRLRLLLSLPLIALVLISLQLPLLMRGQQSTGLKVAVLCFTDTNQETVRWSDGVISLLQNIGQGFGLVMEERENGDAGTPITSGVPLSYFMISVSPLPSVLDGYSVNWLHYHARFNTNTPYSGLAELLSLNTPLGVFVPLVIYWLGLILCRFFRNRDIWSELGFFVFILIMFLGFLQYQQYPLRTSFRFFYAAALLLIGLNAVGYWFSRRNQGGGGRAL